MEKVLERPPTLVELVNHVPVGDKWLQLGRQLNLDQGVLDQVALAASSSSYMFQSWLDNNSNATRRDVLVALENIGERTIADRYESWIRAEEEVNEPVAVTSPVSKPLSPSVVSNSLPDGVLNESHAPLILSAINSLNEWEILGVYLGFKDSMLQEIKHRYFHGVQACRTKVILQWLQGGTATRQELIQALAVMDRTDLVAKVQALTTDGQSDSERSSTDPRHTGAADKVPVTLDSLMKLLAPIAYQWYEIGLSLCVSTDFLLSLRMSKESDAVKLYHVLQRWMVAMPTPVTWDTIMDVVSGPIINDERISSDIALFLEKGQKSDSEIEARHTGAADNVPVTLDSLMELLSPIADQWHEIGVSLNLSTDFVRSVHMSNESDMVKLYRVLQRWMGSMPTPVTWDTIMDVVSGPVINNQRISSDIAQFLEKGQSESETEARHTGAADEVPVTLASLLKLLSPIADKWYEIGLSLDVKDNFLELLERRNETNLMKLSYVLERWMDAKPTPVTWDTIMDAVSSPIVDNPVISGEIAQFLKKESKSFKLSTEAKLIGVVDQKYLEDAMKKGSVKFHVTKAVVQGEARAGKTSLKCLLLEQPYDKLSTSCIEAPQVAYGSFSVNRFGRTDKCWTLVEDDELSDKVLAELQLIAETKVVKEEAEPVTTDARPEPVGIQDSGHTGPVTPTLQHDTSTHVSPSLEPLASGQAITNSQSHQREAIAKVKELYEQCKKVQRKEGLSLHQEWLHFIDSGGQIQFQKLLPAFMPCASVLILVLNLANKLSDPSSTAMQLEHDQSISVSEHSLTVEEILKQLLSAIAFGTKRFNSLVSKDATLFKYIKPPKEKLSVVTVATHRDEYDQKEKEGKAESLKEKEARLKQIFDSVSDSCSVVRGDPPYCHILHEVDGSKATRGEFDDPVVEQIARKLRDQAYEIEVPIKWYCFSVLLRKVAKEGCGVLSVSYCQALGQQLNISGDEVVSALKFFHMLNMLLYYPDSPVADMVFVVLDSLIDVIKELVVLVCITRENWLAAEDDVKELATKGFLSVEVLEKMGQTYSKVSSIFPEFGGKLLSLFQHLLLATCLHEKNKFFMPALLPVKDVSDVNPFPERTPFLFAFKNAVPMGLFCAFIVHLLSLKQDPTAGSSCTSDYESSPSSDDDDYDEEDYTIFHNQWRIITEDLNCSNYFTLQNSNMEGTFVFVERLNCIELHAESPTAQVVEVAKDIIDATVKKWGLKERAKKAFYCSCSGGGGIKHIASFCKVKSARKHVLFCKKGGIELSLDEEKSRWFNRTAGDGKGTSLSATVQSRLKDEPVLKDVIAQLVPIAKEWHELGLALNLKSHDLDPLREIFSVKVRLSKVLEKWKDNTSPPYTWATIIDAVSGPLIGNKDVCAKIQQFLETTEATK